VERTFNIKSTSKVVRFKPNQPAIVVNLVIETEVFKARGVDDEAE
jgi:hypothetical protein